MSVWKVLNPDAYTLETLTATINKLPFNPSMIGGMGIFIESGVATLSALIEELEETIALLAPKARNSPGHVVNLDKRKLYGISIPHIPQTGSVMADSVQGVREFGEEDKTKTVDAERDRKLAKMRSQLDLVIEYHRLLALQGNYMDINGTIQSAYALLGGSRDSVDFVLGTAGTNVRSKCLDVIAHVEEGLGGLPYKEIHALADKDLWKKLITHAKVEETYLNTSMASSLRTGLTGTLEFGDIIWHRYRGAGTVSVPTGKALAFPVGVQGDMYMTRFAPANYVETVNTIGLPYYAKAEEMKFGKGVEIEAQSNPLNICTRPTALVEITTSN